LDNLTVRVKGVQSYSCRTPRAVQSYREAVQSKNPYSTVS
jgi:hypothetical protein